MTQPQRDLAAAYNGVYVGKIVRHPAGKSGQWVVVPRLNGATAVRVAASALGDVNDDDEDFEPIPVFVATLSGLKDILGVIARIQS